MSSISDLPAVIQRYLDLKGVKPLKCFFMREPNLKDFDLDDLDIPALGFPLGGQANVEGTPEHEALLLSRQDRQVQIFNHYERAFPGGISFPALIKAGVNPSSVLIARVDNWTHCFPAEYLIPYLNDYLERTVDHDQGANVLASFLIDQGLHPILPGTSAPDQHRELERFKSEHHTTIVQWLEEHCGNAVVLFDYVVSHFKLMKEDLLEQTQDPASWSHFTGGFGVRGDGRRVIDCALQLGQFHRKDLATAKPTAEVILEVRRKRHEMSLGGQAVPMREHVTSNPRPRHTTGAPRKFHYPNAYQEETAFTPVARQVKLPFAVPLAKKAVALLNLTRSTSPSSNSKGGRSHLGGLSLFPKVAEPPAMRRGPAHAASEAQHTQSASHPTVLRTQEPGLPSAGSTAQPETSSRPGARPLLPRNPLSRHRNNPAEETDIAVEETIPWSAATDNWKRDEERENERLLREGLRARQAGQGSAESAEKGRRRRKQPVQALLDLFRR